MGKVGPDNKLYQPCTPPPPELLEDDDNYDMSFPKVPTLISIEALNCEEVGEDKEKLEQVQNDGEDVKKDQDLKEDEVANDTDTKKPKKSARRF